MRVRPNPAATVGILSLLGLASALLSVLIPASLTGRHSPLFIGSALGLGPWNIFGALLSVYFWGYVGIRSVGKGIGLVLASTVSYFLAMFPAAILGLFLGGVMKPSPDGSLIHGNELTAGMVAALLSAGIAGAFLMVLAVLRLYGGDDGRRAATKSLRWSLCGGLFAIVGWALGPLLGGTVWSTLVAMGLNDLPREVAVADGSLNSYSVHIVWQFGMGITLGALLSNTQLAIPPSEPHAVRVRKRNFANLVLFGLMAVGVGWMGVRWVPNEYRGMRRQQAFAKHEAAKPSGGSVPRVEIKPAEEMLIVMPFGQYLPVLPGAGRGTKSPAFPVDSVGYTVRYSLPGAPTSGNVGSHVDLNLQVWPNPNWAKWEMDEQNFSPSLNQGMESSIKFGNRVVCNQTSSRCAWVSHNRLLMFDFSSVAPDEFLTRYLQKYPSTL